jgi:hypothetical protein
MAQPLRFRNILPIVQTAAAAFFGGWGLAQRNAILSRPFLVGMTGWDTTSRYHIWPWPYKFGAISNVPALLGGLLLSWPIDAVGPGLPESWVMAPSLLLVVLLWYLVGLWLDTRWSVGDKIPWIALVFFTLICLIGALAPSRYLGDVGYFPYGIAVWAIAAIILYRVPRRARG